MNDQEEDYPLIQDLRDWEDRQDYYERIGLNSQGLSDEWEEGIPPEIQELIDWYKNNP